MRNSLAYIHPEAKIAENVTIEPFAVIGKDVVIGKGTWIGSHVTIMDGARIGENCKIFPGAVISAVPQDLKYNGEKTIVRIGNRTTIRECVTVNKGTSDRLETVIGDDCLIMAYSHIAHDCIVGNHCIFSNGTNLAGHVVVGNHVVMAGMTAAQQFCSIGNYAFVTGGSMVRKDVPPYIKVAREPLSYAGVNSVGLGRNGFSVEKIREIQDIYRVLFQGKKNMSQAIAYVEENFEETQERTIILDFIKKSKKGVIRGFSND